MASATGSIVVGQTEVHLNKTIAEVRGLPPIFTTTAAVSTDATVYTFDDENHSDSAGVYYIEAEDSVEGAEYTEYMGLVTLHGSGSNYMIQKRYGSDSTFVRDGTNTQSIASAWTKNVGYKTAIAYHADEAQMFINYNGTASPDDTYDGAFGKNLNAIKLCEDSDVSMKLRDLRRYNIDTYQDGKDKIDALMS